MFGQSKFGQTKFGQSFGEGYELQNDLWVIQCPKPDYWARIDKKIADLQKCEGEINVS